MSFETDDVKGSFDSTISFGMQWRMSGTSCSIIGNDNGGCVPTTGTLGEVVNGPGFGFTSDPDFNYLQADNGNLNYKKNQLVSAALKGNHELALKFKEGWSALGRFTWLYDPAADNTERTPLTSDAKNIAVHNITLLDAWVAKDFEVAGRPAKVRVGNQVISWGEDIFIYGGINVINAIDLTRVHKPGVQLKEIFRPAPIASFNIGATNNLSVEGFWQMRWNSFRFDPVGTYFSTADVAGNGQQPAFVPSSLLPAPPGTVGDPGTISNGEIIPAGQRFTYNDLLEIGTVIPVIPTQSPPNLNQFGFAMRYKPDNSNAEWGFYYLHYNDKIPYLGFVNDPSITANPFGLGYYLQYPASRNLFGVSVNGNIGDWAVGAELSLPAEGRRGNRPHGAACRRILRVLCAGRLSWLRRLQEVAGASHGDLPARTKRRSGLAAARSERGRRHPAPGSRDGLLSRPRPFWQVSPLLAELRVAGQVVDRDGGFVQRRLPAHLRLAGEPDPADRRPLGHQRNQRRTPFRSSRVASP